MRDSGKGSNPYVGNKSKFVRKNGSGGGPGEAPGSGLNTFGDWTGGLGLIVSFSCKVNSSSVNRRLRIGVTPESGLKTAGESGGSLRLMAWYGFNASLSRL